MLVRNEKICHKDTKALRGTKKEIFKKESLVPWWLKIKEIL